MNDRIRQLATQAESSANEVFDFDGRDWHDIVYEKFAELIVEECVLGIKMTRVRDGYDTKHYLQSQKHIDYIRKQFGVEE